MTENNAMVLQLIQLSIQYFDNKINCDKQSSDNMLLDDNINTDNIYFLLNKYFSDLGDGLLEISKIYKEEEDYDVIVIRFADHLRIYDFSICIVVMEDNELNHKIINILSRSSMLFEDYKIEDNMDLYIDLLRKQYSQYLRLSMQDGECGIEGISTIHCKRFLDIYSVIMAILFTLSEYITYEDELKEALEEAVRKGILERK